MATGGEVLQLLCPNVEYTIWGDDYDLIEWYGKSPAISKAEFEAGFDKVEEAKAQAEAQAKAAKQAILDRLGLTEDELRIVLG